ncbi:MAG: ABC transporter permease [Proteobacteria bacterium]|nr:ABC transporter permease [Pseudomonadota bacterium]
MRRVPAFIYKEFIHIYRDPRTLIMVFVLPVFMLIIMGSAITMDVKNIALGVLDLDNSQDSREIRDMMVRSGYFQLKATPSDDRELEDLIRSGKVDVGIKFNHSFSRKLKGGKASPIQLIVDGADSNTATVIIGYCESILQRFSLARLSSLIKGRGGAGSPAIPPVDPEIRIWFNPDLKSTNFLVPGLVGLVMMITLVPLTSMSVVKEKEQGTIEGIMVAPISPLEFIVGKLTPYMFIAYGDLFLVIVCGIFIFDVPFRGSYLLLFGLSFIFILCALSLGLLISTVAGSQRIAWQLSILTSILPSIFLSGFTFPVESMPVALQVICSLFPVRYYLVILQGIILKGVGFSALIPETVILAIFASALITISVSRFKKRIS